ncbi:hypothetical protein BB561_002156 [Smittium simulii]|uniref:ATP synthase subunit 5, mitochondrial n=1 Tax=Smittium simulii TaxID=133385 RepID=A0A2T9YRL1_9FUNG|nr:hypothetical protein BB561_002156 [Smittium simulii]
MFTATRSIFKTAQLTRSYASQTKTKAPLVLHGIAGKYATALFEAASTQNALEPVEKDLTLLSNKMKKNPALLEFLISPIVDKALKEKVLQYSQSNQTSTNFFKLLLENNRISNITAISQDYSNLMQAHRGILVVKVTTATPLDAKTLNSVKDIINAQGLAKQAKQLNIVNTINHTILGGMVVEFADYTVDMSVSSKIAKLDKLLTDNINA